MARRRQRIDDDKEASEERRIVEMEKAAKPAKMNRVRKKGSRSS
jgi:hypothetical protein